MLLSLLYYVVVSTFFFIIFYSFLFLSISNDVDND